MRLNDWEVHTVLHQEYAQGKGILEWNSWCYQRWQVSSTTMYLLWNFAGCKEKHSESHFDGLNYSLREKLTEIGQIFLGWIKLKCDNSIDICASRECFQETAEFEANQNTAWIWNDFMAITGFAWINIVNGVFSNENQQEKFLWTCMRIYSWA